MGWSRWVPGWLKREVVQDHQPKPESNNAPSPPVRATLPIPPGSDETRDSSFDSPLWPRR